MASLGYLQVTRQCNQRCLFCSNPPTGREIPLQEAVARAEILVQGGSTGVILTGGEPTLYPDLVELVASLTGRGIPCRIITNGQKLAEGDLVDRLLGAGLEHLHVSLYSHREEVQDHLTRNPGSGGRVSRALERLGRRRVTVDLNVVINAQNADHLHLIAGYVVDRLPFIRHVVWNNLDPSAERVRRHPETIPRLASFAVTLHRALHRLAAAGVTFRVERVPLCAMTEFAHTATETRKIVRQEGRLTHFLDEKGLFAQQTRDDWSRGKAPVCRHCRLDPLCAGLDSLDVHYSSAELAPVFVDPEPIRRRILGLTRPCPL